jgi:hypothetical protein
MWVFGLRQVFRAALAGDGPEFARRLAVVHPAVAVAMGSKVIRTPRCIFP